MEKFFYTDKEVDYEIRRAHTHGVWVGVGIGLIASLSVLFAFLVIGLATGL